MSTSIHAARHYSVAPPGAVKLVGLTPIVAFLSCVGWSYVVGSALRGPLLGAGVSLFRIGYWATEIPLYRFWAPTALIGFTATCRSALQGQRWQALLVALYYFTALVLILFGAFVFSPAPIGDL